MSAMLALNKSSRSHNVGITKLYENAAALDRLGIGFLRLGLVVVLLWIGLLKLFRTKQRASYRWWQTVL